MFKRLDGSFAFRSETNAFSIFCDERKSSYTMQKTHIHDMYEIYYLLSGERYYFIKDRTYHVKKGDIVLINCHVLHKTIESSSPGHKRILIHIDPEVLSNYCGSETLMLSLFQSEMPVISSESINQLYAEPLFQKIFQSLKSQSVFKEISAIAALIELLVFISDSKNSAIQKNPAHPTQLHKKISEVVNYINANYKKDISLDYVASQFYISSSYLCKIFKKATGFNFIEYLNSIRISKARQMLIDTNHSITTIAEKTGFHSISHFGRVFKSITGLSPAKYRRFPSQKPKY